MSNDKLAEALEHTARHRAATEGIDPDQWRVVLFKWEALALQAHAAEAARAQAQSSEWVMVPREPTKAMIEASCKIKLGRLEALRDGHGASSGVASAVREEWDAMLAAAPQQAAEPVAWRCTWARTKWSQYHDEEDPLPDKWDDDPPDQILPLYTHPQPAQDAKLPSDEDFRLHLGELTSAELRVAQAAFRYAMAKESGR